MDTALDTKHAFPVGTLVVERAYPDSFKGVVTGHAPDGWTFVKWGMTGRTLSHPPHELITADES